MKKKIAFISTDYADNEYRSKFNKYGGVSYYRLVKPMELLKKEYDVTFYGADLQEQANKFPNDDKFYAWLTWEYDMIIVKQIDNAHASQLLIHYANENECILVQDYDDNMLKVREDQPSYKMGYYPGGARWSYAASMMSLADALIVSTKPLKDYFFKFVKDNFKEEKDIYIFPNYNDIRDWQKTKWEKNNDKIVIGWAGSVTHDADLNLVMPALGKILDKYPNVHLELLGGILQGSIAYLTQTFSPEAKKKVRIIYGTPAWDQYPKLMLSQMWDIGIAPLIDDEFNESKSHIKWMEYTMMGIPVIASDAYPYKENIPEGCGFLAKSDEWEEKLSQLIENKGMRISLYTKAQEYIENNLQWKQHEGEYLKIVQSIFKKHKKN